MRHSVPTTRIALFSDTHVWDAQAPKTGSLDNLIHLDASRELSALLVDCVNDAQPEVAFHLGDQISGGGYFGTPPGDFRAELLRLRAVLAGLRAPLHVTPGNHDCPSGTGDWSIFEQAWGLGRGLGSTVDVDDVRLVVINAQGHDVRQVENALRAQAEHVGQTPEEPIYGWVNETELERIEDALASAGGRRVILLSHQLLQPWSNPAMPWQEYYGIANADAVLALAARHDNVHAAIAGHAHRFDIGWRRVGTRDCAFVVMPAIIEYPLAWLLMEVSAAHISLSLQQLPRPDLIRAAHATGDNRWRAGNPEWQKIVIA